MLNSMIAGALDSGNPQLKKSVQLQETIAGTAWCDSNTKVPKSHTKIGILTAIKGSAQKRILWRDGKAIKDGNHFLGIPVGKFQNAYVDGLEGLRALLSGIESNQALTLGTAESDEPLHLVTDGKAADYRKDGYTNIIARTKDYIREPDDGSFLLLDHDTEPGKPSLSADEFWGELLSIMPEMASVGRLTTPSSSSAIYHKETGECLRPEDSHHTFIQVRGDLNRFVDLIKVRGWLEGYSFFKLGNPNSQNGTRAILERHLLDTSVFSFERLVYEAGACFEPDSPLEQRRSEPVVYAGAVLDFDALPLPTTAERAKAERLRSKARKAIDAQRVTKLSTRLEKQGVPNSRKEAVRRLARTDRSKLTADHILHLVGGGIMRAGDITAAHDGVLLKDPQEPDYRGGAQVAKIFASDAGWTIVSQAHGGCKYKLQQTEATKAKAKNSKESLWLKSLIQATKLPQTTEPSRKAINRALEQRQLIAQNHTIGSYEAIAEIGSYAPFKRLMYVIDGQKATRKSSVAIASIIELATSKSERVLVAVPTTVLARNMAATLTHLLPGLDIKHHEQSRAAHAAVVVSCPESLHKFADGDFGCVVFDEANECITRLLDGSLGKNPAGNRKAFTKMLLHAHTAVVSTDKMSRATVNEVQQRGHFTADEIKVIQRKRKPSQLTVKVAQDSHKDNRALLLATCQIIEAVVNGERVAVACGSKNGARALQKAAKAFFKGMGIKKNIRCVDGPHSFKKTKDSLAKSPDRWLTDNAVDLLLYTPVFNSGVSFESDYFDKQYELTAAYEPATRISQRGERIRSALGTGTIKERFVRFTTHALPQHPDPLLFTAEYWEDFLKRVCEIEGRIVSSKLKGATGQTQAFSIKRAKKLNIEPSDIPRLAQIEAQNVREVYFKRECLEDEWLGNGWQIETPDYAHYEKQPFPGQPMQSPSMMEQVRLFLLCGKAECVRSQSSSMAKAKGREGGTDILREDGSKNPIEKQGPIGKIQQEKHLLQKTLGADFSLVNDAEFIRLWKISPDGLGLASQRVWSLIHTAINQPELWERACDVAALRELGTEEIKKHLPELPFTKKDIQRAKLLMDCPGLSAVLTGGSKTWSAKSDFAGSAGSYLRAHSKDLLALSKANSRITGLKFTEDISDIRCFHKALEMAGVFIRSDKRTKKGRSYTLQCSEGIERDQQERFDAAVQKGGLEAAEKAEKPKDKEIRFTHAQTIRAQLISKLAVLDLPTIKKAIIDGVNKLNLLKPLPDIDSDDRLYLLRRHIDKVGHHYDAIPRVSAIPPINNLKNAPVKQPIKPIKSVITSVVGKRISDICTYIGTAHEAITLKKVQISKLSNTEAVVRAIDKQEYTVPLNDLIPAAILRGVA